MLAITPPLLVESHSTTLVDGLAAPLRPTCPAWLTANHLAPDPVARPTRPGIGARFAAATEPGDLSALRWGAVAAVLIDAGLLFHHFAPALAGWLFH